MIIYGRNAVREALRGRRSKSVTEVLAINSLAAESWLRGTPLSHAGAAELERACGSAEHQGVCARVGDFPYVASEELLGPDCFILALDEVKDPQNLGALCRTAECVGVSGVVICERRAAEVTPAVCRASAGAVEHLRIARARNLADFLLAAKRAGCWCYGAAIDDAAVDYGVFWVLQQGNAGGYAIKNTMEMAEHYACNNRSTGVLATQLQLYYR